MRGEAGPAASRGGMVGVSAPGRPVLKYGPVVVADYAEKSDAISERLFNDRIEGLLPAGRSGRRRKHDAFADPCRIPRCRRMEDEWNRPVASGTNASASSLSWLIIGGARWRAPLSGSDPAKRNVRPCFWMAASWRRSADRSSRRFADTRREWKWRQDRKDCRSCT